MDEETVNPSHGQMCSNGLRSNTPPRKNQDPAAAAAPRRSLPESSRPGACQYSSASAAPTSKVEDPVDGAAAGDVLVVSWRVGLLPVVTGTRRRRLLRPGRSRRRASWDGGFRRGAGRSGGKGGTMGGCEEGVVPEIDHGRGAAVVHESSAWNCSGHALVSVPGLILGTRRHQAAVRRRKRMKAMRKREVCVVKESHLRDGLG
ncbi:hypothetical protein HPP92_000363 [Vanilla planifolia]|uniref:Uncharacterized protein n=1 Tax=Vanilla planifolia TaxID=51239 RepID=A0A835S161_VANPL|nr:hypothetical protein HPP92_000363 [Vanilla planifolia]